MKIAISSPRFIALALAGAATLLFSGCITISENTYGRMMAYAPVPSPVQLDASASISVTDELSPDQRAVWKKWMNNDNSITNYQRAIEKSISNDFTYCGLFARIVTEPSVRPTFEIRVACYESHPDDFRLKITVTATETATGEQVSFRSREHSLGRSMFEVKINERLPGLVALAKADLAADLQALMRKKDEQVRQAEAELLAKASLSELLSVAAEKSPTLARARNHALIAARTQQLPEILRNSKSDELTTLTIKIEQLILDLNHECEIARDNTQRDPASSDNPTAFRRGGANPADTRSDDIRDLSLCYRERIELLKPMLADLKEELANRSR